MTKFIYILFLLVLSLSSYAQRIYNVVDYGAVGNKTIDDAKAIKDMLMCYFLNVCKSPNADIFELLQRIERIPYEYDKNHPKQPIVGKAAQVVVSNKGNVKYFKNKTNGKRK